MTIRTSSKTVTFAHPFMLKAVDRILAAGEYRVVTDEELKDYHFRFIAAWPL